MVILGIETSCDETALSLIEASGTLEKGIEIAVLADKTLSQIEIHRTYGGVFPTLAKREHSRNLIPLLEVILTEAGFGNPKSQKPNFKQIPNSKLEKILNREPELLTQFLEFIPAIEKPPIDAIAVTVGPGLEPCLWTGVNFAQALSLVWDIPIVPVNHMEGHIFSALLRAEESSNNQTPNPKQTPNLNSEIPNAKRYTLDAPRFPAIALLISGGHTELVVIRDYFKYEIIGRTRDDAVGEAFDKVARLLGLPYPGGPQISALAEELRSKNYELREKRKVQLPRPMLRSDDFDFSFSGLKTAVLYLLKKIGAPDEKARSAIALEFENAVTEVLVAKTKRAIENYCAKSLLIGGGVIANSHIRRAFEQLATDVVVPLFIPEENLTTDNALMIAVAGFLRLTLKNGSTKPQDEKLAAKGNLTLDKERGLC